ncbi:hypothetical protein MMC22_002488 [Lobaria immixta]|nr:hypothetical protein [Lobaria immixta]
MDHSPSSRHSHNSAEVNQRRVEREAKQWAEGVNEENAWDSLLLALDGGGIRGYSSLLILLELMNRIAHWENKLNNTHLTPENLLPCHYFDHIWGTSTGGLIAIMLGRLRMSVPQALSVYREFGESIFGRKQKRALNGLNVFAARYKHANVTKVIDNIVGKHCKEHTAGSCKEDRMFWKVSSPENGRNISSPENDHVDHWHLCQAACVTARVDGKCLLTLPLRTYRYFHHELLFSPDPTLGVQEDDFLIREAGRATSAAPFYFENFEKKKDGKLRKYIDGGIILNNPSHRMLIEIRDRCAWWNNGQKKDPAVLLSVGTGVPGNPFFTPTKSFWNSFKQKWAVGKHVLIRYTEGETIHRSLRAEVDGEHKYYKRLNVDQGLDGIGLDDWRSGQWKDEESQRGGATLTKMEVAVKHYIERETLNTENQIEWHLLPKTLIDHTAERLVRHRTERARLATMNVHRDRWYRYRGGYISGNLKDNWNEESGDGPHER